MQYGHVGLLLSLWYSVFWFLIYAPLHTTNDNIPCCKMRFIYMCFHVIVDQLGEYSLNKTAICSMSKLYNNGYSGTSDVYRAIDHTVMRNSNEKRFRLPQCSLCVSFLIHTYGTISPLHLLPIIIPQMNSIITFCESSSVLIYWFADSIQVFVSRPH